MSANELRTKHEKHIKVKEPSIWRKKVIKNELIKKKGKMVTTKEKKREIPEKEKTIGAKYSPSEVLPPDSDPVVITSESNLIKSL